MPSIAIIGGGVAGIAAAQLLRQTQPTWEIRLFERANRLGGRAITDTASIRGFAFDQGAVYLQDSATNPLTTIAEELGFETTEVPDSNDQLRCPGVDGWHDLPVYTPSVQLPIEQIRASFAVAAELNGEDEASYPNAPVTVQPVLDTPALQFAYGISEYGGFSESAETWQYLAADSERQVTPAEPSPNLYVTDGIGTLVQTWGEGVLEGNAALNAPVTALDYNADGVTLHWHDGNQDRQGAFDACIVTLPVAVLARGDIAFNPILPALHLAALQALRLGSYKKFALAMTQVPEDLDGPHNTYYLTQGGPGQDGPSGVWQVFRQPQAEDATPVLLVHAAGDLAAALDALNDEAAFGLCIARLRQAWPDLGLDAAHRALTRWNTNPLSRGAYSYTRPSAGRPAEDPSALAARTNLGQPIERLHFAGEATSTACYGTLQAAYFEGQRAAQAVIDQLTPQH